MRVSVLFLLFLGSSLVHAEEIAASDSGRQSEKSPWVFTSVLSSDPKVSTSAGAVAAYTHRFDDISSLSKIFVGGSYSITHSYRYGLYWNLFFSQNRQHLTGAIVSGKFRNDFGDFLGSGLPAQTTDSLRLFAMRYLYRVVSNWYVGPQLISTNYTISGDSAMLGKVLEKVGLLGFKSNGIGLAIQYDSRNDPDSPSAGQFLLWHNIAYRKDLGGAVSFDAYHVDYRFFHTHGSRLVTAMQVKGRWSVKAPPGGFSTVQLPGYVRGEHLSQHMALVQIDERYTLTEKWGVAAFAGLEILYGKKFGFGGANRWFPDVGMGMFYLLNRGGMVIRSNLALGKKGAWGIYLNFGHLF